MSEKLHFKDAQYYGSGRIAVPKSLDDSIPHFFDGERKFISVLDSHKIYSHGSAQGVPYWWEKIVEQSKFVADSDGSSIIVKLPDDAYVVTGFYSDSFFQWLETIKSDGVIFDREVGGIIIDSPEWPEETNKMLSAHGVRTTDVAAEFISPITQRSIELKKFSDSAYEDGFRVPDKNIYPSSRSLKGHQVPVVLSLAKRGEGILADDVGSGKSSMFICGFLSLAQYLMEYKGYDQKDTWPLVIVTKKSLVGPTKEEFLKWVDNANVHAIAGKKTYDIPEDVNAIVVPLSSLDKCLDNILKLHPKGVIFDESHLVKSLSANRTQAAVKLASFIKEYNDNPYVVCVSATPMPNRPAELWSQLVITGMDKEIIKYAESKQKFPRNVRISMRGRYFPKINDNFKFDIRYCDGKTGYFGWDNKGSSNEKELSELLYSNGFIRRRKFEFITPLPLLHQGFVHTKISQEDKERYALAEEEFKAHLVKTLRQQSRKEKWDGRKLRQETFEKLNKADTAEAIMQMTELRKLVEEIKVPGTVEWIHRFFDKDPSIVGKDIDGRKKLIVFVHHRSVQDMMINHPELQDYGVLSITAKTKKVNEIVDEFQDWDSGKNLIILYSGAAEGLTLTAAKDVYIHSLPFSFYNIIQMAGRCWARISEDYPPHEAYVHYATSDLGIDEYMANLIRSKSWLNKTIIDGEEAIDAINKAESGDDEDETSTSKSIFAAVMSH